jgi:hypothetical protein
LQALAHSDPTVFMSWSCGITVAWLVTDTLVVAGAMQTLPTPARAAATLVLTRMARVMLGARPLRVSHCEGALAGTRCGSTTWVPRWRRRRW